MISLILVGAVSAYQPGDGHNHGKLSCGGTLTWQSRHVAIRAWRGRCGAPVLVCSDETGRCIYTTVEDSGPWGAVDRKGQWRVWPRHRLPRGWKRRGVVDLSPGAYRELGRPRFLSRVTVVVYRTGDGDV